VNLDYRPFDADNHYYEPLDAFTRHQDPSMRRRGVQVVTEGKRSFIVVADRVNRFVPNPTFDPVIVPGSTELQFRGQIPDGVDPASLMKVERIRPEFRDAEARLRVMDEQGLAGALLFPTIGVGIEEDLTHDPEATLSCVSAFNRWLEEDWGFARENRIFGVPLLSLADPDAAIIELESLLSRGAKILHLRPAPVPGVDGPRSFGHPAHDAVWARIAEADVPVAFHIGDSGYTRHSGAWGGQARFEAFTARDPLDSILVDDRAIFDTMASMIAHGVFHRHPTLRVLSVENGSDWVAPLVKKLRKRANQSPDWFPEDPLDVVRRNVWVTPYYEEDLAALVEVVGIDRVLFGSDWPHGEGLAEPMQFTKELTAFTDEDVRRIMRDNLAELLGDVEIAS
jgi:predicted TIM-barrel fold metal-dependent hydrolase